MLDLKDLQKSLHKHTVASIDSLTLIKAKLEFELKSKELPEHQREIFQADMRRCDNIIESMLSLQTMDEYYKFNYGLFPALFVHQSEGKK